MFGGCDDVQSAVVGSGMCGDGEVHIYLGTSAWVAAPSKTATKFMHGAAAIQSADPEMNLIAGITEAAGSNIQWISATSSSNTKRRSWARVSTSIWTASSTTSPQDRTTSSALRGCWAKDVPSAVRRTRATLFNINPTHTREHLMRAVYEGIAYNLRWILENYRKDYGFEGNNFRIIGGGALDRGWMQIIADVTGCTFSVVRNPRNAGALGSAIIALIGYTYIYCRREEFRADRGDLQAR